MSMENGSGPPSDHGLGGLVGALGGVCAAVVLVVALPLLAGLLYLVLFLLGAAYALHLGL